VVVVLTNHIHFLQSHLETNNMRRVCDFMA
jgi:hypothetical protein